jgi:hypothetical protein
MRANRAATLVSFLLLGSIAPPARALIDGDIIVIDRDGTAPGAPGSLFIVDRSTGARTLVSDFGNVGQGPLGNDPIGAIAPDLLSLLVIDQNAGTGQAGALFVVDIATGVRSVLSDFGAIAQGPLAPQPVALALEASGNVLAVDPTAGSNFNGAMYRVDRASGARIVVSDFGSAGQGPLGANPVGVAVAVSGEVYVVDEGAGTNGSGALFRVDATTGTRTLTSDFGNAGQGPVGANPIGVSISDAGRVFVIDYDNGTQNRGALFEVAPATGLRTLVSDLGNPAQGALGDFPYGVATEASGAVLVVDRDLGTAVRGSVSRVDVATGIRTLLSDFGLATQGPLGLTPIGISVVRDRGGILRNGFESP